MRTQGVPVYEHGVFFFRQCVCLCAPHRAAALRDAEPVAKAAQVRALYDALRAGQAAIAPSLELPEPADLPGRPARPPLVEPRQLERRSMRSPEGRAVLLHALAHIEFNAINLALDAVWRFAGLPAPFYADWLKVAAEEAYHFTLLSERLAAFGHAYGDFPAHNGLWEMCERTKGDVLARMALVPRTLEARGPTHRRRSARGSCRRATMRRPRSST